MRVTDDNLSAETIAQTKKALLKNVHDAIAGVNKLTENLERLRAIVDEKRRSAR
jgi:outer membrane protein TolC